MHSPSQSASETLVYFNETIRRYTPQNSHLNYYKPSSFLRCTFCCGKLVTFPVWRPAPISIRLWVISKDPSRKLRTVERVYKKSLTLRSTITLLSAHSRLISIAYLTYWRSQWPRGLRRRSAAAWLLESWVWIPLRAWMFVSCVSMLCCPV
jgi:hypothetical protein